MFRLPFFVKDDSDRENLMRVIMVEACDNDLRDAGWRLDGPGMSAGQRKK